jgi:hypothetical protein
VHAFEESGCSIGEFWHTLTQVDQFFYGLGQVKNYPGPQQEFIRHQQTKWASFLIDLYHAILERGTKVKQLRNDMKAVGIGGVDVVVLSPSQDTQNAFARAYQRGLQNDSQETPDPNLLSAVLALRYGQAVVLLGGDALKKNWREATPVAKSASLPKAVVLKVPHHGAKNAFQVNPSRHQSNYLDPCRSEPRAVAVVFPGDARHPHPTVRNCLEQKTELHTVGTPRKNVVDNPLKIGIPGACSANVPAQGVPIVTVEISMEADVHVAANHH